MIKRKRIRVRDIHVSYLFDNEKGSKAYSIVFLHGFPFNKEIWRAQLEQLPDVVQGIAIDIRGHGQSTRGHGVFSIDVFADDLLETVQRLDLTNVVLCGVSMGGYIALRAYEKKPEIFQGLILADTHSYADTDAQKQKRFDSIQSVLTHGKRAFSINFVKQVLSAHTLERHPEVAKLIKGTIRGNKEINICSTLLALAARTDTTSSLHKINVPVLLLRGTEDQLISKAQMASMETQIPDVRHVEMEGCGHLPNLENPRRFNGEVRNFLISKILSI